MEADAMTRQRSDLERLRRAHTQARWGVVIASAAMGMILVALASRLGDAAAVGTALFAIVSVSVGVWNAMAEGRRWRLAFGAPGSDHEGRVSRRHTGLSGCHATPVRVDDEPAIRIRAVDGTQGTPGR